MSKYATRRITVEWESTPQLWRAYDPDDEDGETYITTGWGDTAEEAVFDLAEQMLETRA